MFWDKHRKSVNKLFIRGSHIWQRLKEFVLSEKAQNKQKAFLELAVEVVLKRVCLFRTFLAVVVPRSRRLYWPSWDVIFYCGRNGGRSVSAPHWHCPFSGLCVFCVGFDDFSCCNGSERQTIDGEKSRGSPSSWLETQECLFAIHHSSPSPSSHTLPKLLLPLFSFSLDASRKALVWLQSSFLMLTVENTI